MELSISLPDHVAAAFEDAATAEAEAVAHLTEIAKDAAIAAAADEANALIRAAEAPFDGTEAPTVKTVPERVQEVESDQVALRAQVRSVGVALATAAGVPQDDAVDMIEAALQTP